MHFVRDGFNIGASESVRANVTLEVGTVGELVIIETNTKPDIESRPGSTIFRGKALTDLPPPKR